MNEQTRTLLEEVKESYKHSGELISQLEAKLEEEQQVNSTIKITRKGGRKLLFIAAADNSGSIGRFERDTFKSAYKQLSDALIDTYDSVDFRTIHFTTVAKEVSLEDFLERGESGGTIVSSGLRMAFDKINDELFRSKDDKTDIAVLLLSDGDNLTSDCFRAQRIAEAISEKANFYYLESNPYNRQSVLKSLLINTRGSLGISVILDKAGVDLAATSAYERLIKHKVAE